MSRVVALADMNSFYSSCHVAENPDLEGKKVIVAGDPRKRTGIVLAASYPAKAVGVRTGMALGEAKRLCPNAIFFKPHFPLYLDYSSRILKIMRDFTDLVEPFSIDEAFIQLSGITHLFGPPPLIAAKLQYRIRTELGVNCSIGIGPNKLIAKMAAELKKPNGISYLKSLEQYRQVFYPMKVRKLFGIGPKYERHLRYFNIHTIGELANFPVDILKKRWGKNGLLMWYCAQGIDNSPIVPESLDTSKSIGKQRTLPRDLWGFEKIKIIIKELCDLVCRRVRQGGYMGRTVFLTLRDYQLCFLNRSMALPDYTNLPDEVFDAAYSLLRAHWQEDRPVRLVGITLSQLIKKESFQTDLFGKKDRQIKIVEACDNIKNRFGENAIFTAVSLMEDSLYAQR